MERPLLVAHGEARLALEKVWRVWADRFLVADRLKKRVAEMKALAPEIHALSHARQANPKTRGNVSPAVRNGPCPCGSGRKYKHCCGRR
jgi:hypothetical protein